MKVLIACEFSGIVREAFRKRGHDAWSCDLLDSEIPGNHIKGDILEILNDGWDLMIGFPPCTYLTHAANKALRDNPERKEKQLEAAEFFMTLYNSSIDKVCLENPRGHLTRLFRREDQVIEPFEFGEFERKRTCLWLKNLPPLMKGPVNPEGMKPKGMMKRSDNHGRKPGGNVGKYYMHGKNSLDRSRTFTGIANAMAKQWG